MTFSKLVKDLKKKFKNFFSQFEKKIEVPKIKGMPKNFFFIESCLITYIGYPEGLIPLGVGLLEILNNMSNLNFSLNSPPKNINYYNIIILMS